MISRNENGGVATEVTSAAASTTNAVPSCVSSVLQSTSVLKSGQALTSDETAPDVLPLHGNGTACDGRGGLRVQSASPVDQPNILGYLRFLDAYTDRYREADGADLTYCPACGQSTASAERCEFCGEHRSC